MVQLFFSFSAVRDVSRVSLLLFLPYNCLCHCNSQDTANLIQESLVLEKVFQSSGDICTVSSGRVQQVTCKGLASTLDSSSLLIAMVCSIYHCLSFSICKISIIIKPKLT